jgi:hypothetical protein
MPVNIRGHSHLQGLKSTGGRAAMGVAGDGEGILFFLWSPLYLSLKPQEHIGSVLVGGEQYHASTGDMGNDHIHIGVQSSLV